MIQVIDESNVSVSIARDVVHELVAWNEPHSEGILEEALHEWLNQLGNTTLISDLFECYVDIIRGLLVRDDSTTTSGPSGNPSLMMEGIPPFERYVRLLELQSQKMVVQPFENETFAQVLQVITADVLILTRSTHHNDDHVHNQYRCTLGKIVFPKLFQMIRTVLLVTRTEMDRVVLARLSACLLSFGGTLLNEKLSTSLLLPSMVHLDLMEYCVIPVESLPSIKMTWDVVELDDTEWKDVAAVDACGACWNALVQHLGIPIALPVNTSDTLASEVVCGELGWDAIAKAVRVQFFGKEEHKGGTMIVQKFQASQQQQKMLSYPLEVASILPTKPPFQQEPARIHAALSFLSILKMPDPSPQRSQHLHLLEHMVPICFTLLDSSHSDWVALGCASLIRLLQLCPNPDEWKNYEEHLLSLLDMVAKSTDDPISIGFIGLACSQTLTVLDRSVLGSHYRGQRTRFLLRFFDLIMFRSRNRSDKGGMLRNLLIAGVIPLLYQKCTLEDNAPCMEIGRRGLSLLLHLLQWDYGVSGRKVQIASLVALVNLMYGSYPILPHHGGTMVYALVACWAHTRNYESDERLDAEERNLCCIMLDLADHVLFLSLVFCGDSAIQSLQEIQSSPLDPSVVEYAGKIMKRFQKASCHGKSIK